jgi:hypothetical protein
MEIRRIEFKQLEENEQRQFSLSDCTIQRKGPIDELV